MRQSCTADSEVEFVFSVWLFRCKGFQRVSIVETAVGSETGFAELFLSDIYHGSSSLNFDWGPSHESVWVSVTTLGELIKNFGRPYYCKVDVEGYELNVFQGLSKPISLVSFEYHLTERDVEKTFQCVEVLASIHTGDLRINLSPAEQFLLSYSKWLTLEEFRQSFPGSIEGKDGFHYGDVWVKSE